MVKYSTAQKLAALAVLAANAGNISKTARETGIDRVTLRKWRASELNASPEIIALKNAFADAYREKLARAREASLDRMLELIPHETDLHKVTGAVKILSELAITERVVDEYSRPEAAAAAADGAAHDTDGPAQGPSPYN